MLTTAVLALLALVAGATGTWSPCGFSMISTLSMPRSGGGRWLVLAACATFTVGAVAGGVVTFGLLARLGAALGGAGDGWAVWVAVLIAAAAAVGELRGVRIVPQIRRQVPESWRRVMPLPLVAVLYGVLLGLGFTTFVLTLGVWALAGVSVALGSPTLGVVMGVAFGLGRAIPVAVLSPWALGWAAPLVDGMARRPDVLRAVRVCDGVLLAAAAVTLALAAATGTAAAAPPAIITGDGHGLAAAADGALLWVGSDGLAHGALADGTGVQEPAASVAVGGGRLVVTDGTTVWVTTPGAPATAPRTELTGLGQVTGLAVSADWLVWRVPRPLGGDLLMALPLGDPAAPRLIQVTGRATAVTGPALDGATLVFGLSGPRGSSIIRHDLDTGLRRTIRALRVGQLRDPAVSGDRLAYVVHTACAQRLMVGRLTRRHGDRAVLVRGGTAPRDRGHEHGRTTQGSEATQCPAGTPPTTPWMLGPTAVTGAAAYVGFWRAWGTGTISRVLAIPVTD